VHPFKPEKWPALIPRIAVDDPKGLVKFVITVFDAKGSYQGERPTELSIGDSMLSDWRHD